MKFNKDNAKKSVLYNGQTFYWYPSNLATYNESYNYSLDKDGKNKASGYDINRDPNKYFNDGQSTWVTDTGKYVGSLLYDILLNLYNKLEPQFSTAKDGSVQLDDVLVMPESKEDYTPTATNYTADILREGVFDLNDNMTRKLRINGADKYVHSLGLSLLDATQLGNLAELGLLEGALAAFVFNPVATSTALLGANLGAKVWDLAIFPQLNNNHLTYTDYATENGMTPTWASLTNPGSWYGGGVAAKGTAPLYGKTVNGVRYLNENITKPLYHYGKNNYLYFKDFGFKGAPKGADMSKYVPEPLKQSTNLVVDKVVNAHAGLGIVSEIDPYVTWSNKPLVDTDVNYNTGNINFGYPSSRLHNPFQFRSDFVNPFTNKPGINYTFAAGHEPAHLFQTDYYTGTDMNGKPVSKIHGGSYVETGDGRLVQRRPVALLVLENGKPAHLYYEPFVADVNKGKFAALNTDRPVIHPEISDTPNHRAHLKHPGELDADLYALQLQGHIKNGYIDKEGVEFLTSRHNLSEQELYNTIRDLLSIGYGKPVPQALATRPSSLTLAEKLGIPKGDRNTIKYLDNPKARMRREALSDLELYINSGLHRLALHVGDDLNVTYGAKPGNMNDKLIELGQDVTRNYAYNDNGMRIVYDPLKQLITYISASPSIYKLKMLPGVNYGFGDARWANGNIVLTAPQTDALTLAWPEIMTEAELKSLPTTLSKDIMRPFWTAVSDYSRPGTYTSGDFIQKPLGERLIREFLLRKFPRKLNFNDGTSRILGSNGMSLIGELVNRPLVWKGRLAGLSTDSYIALLKQGLRPEYELRYSPDGMTHFNGQGVNHPEIAQAHADMLAGKITQLLFVDMFNKWVEPYSGMPAVIRNIGDKPTVIMPQPFIYKKKGGGTLCQKN